MKNHGVKKYKKQNVYDATQDRLTWIFDNYDNIQVSFSGGKDSGVLLNLVVDYEKRHQTGTTINIYHMDYEAQYDQTTEYVLETIKTMNLPTYHICLPVKTQCAVNMTQGYWRPWAPEDKKIWVRDLPPESIHENNHPFDFYHRGLDDYDFNIEFGKWLSRDKKTACLVGIRSDESLSRQATITSKKRVNKINDVPWSTKLTENLHNFYPIYDWTVHDIWGANALHGFGYNKIYDLYYQSGMSVHEMRVASPFNDAAMGTLGLYKAINPTMWGKMVSRVNGVNYTGIYGGTTAMGWKSITLPKGHTWKSYLYFLLGTLDKKTQANYEQRLGVSIKFWKERGGALSDETIRDLKATGLKFENKGQVSNQSKKEVVTFNEYPDDVNIKNFKDCPSYKRMCICILKNDWFCKYMGFAPTKKEQEKRKITMEKYKSL